MVAIPILEEQSGSAAGAMIAGFADLPQKPATLARFELLNSGRPPRRLAIYPASAGFDRG